MNKIDMVAKDKLPGFMENYRKIYDFEEIIPVCALRGVNMEKVISTIFRFLPYGPKFYDDETITDQPQRQIVAEMIREKALRCLDEEIPHGIAVAIDRMKERPDGSGSMLRRIGSQARMEIEKMMEMKVNLQLWVKVKKDWRDSDFMIKNFGYDKKEI